MLADQDRIFTNIYGWESFSLDAARARGDWDGTAEILAKGRDWIISEMKASGLPGQGWGGLSHRHEMVVYAQGVGWPPALFGD